MRQWLRDTVERTAATFVQTFLALVLAAWQTGVDLATVQAAALAGLAAALAVVKAAVAARWGGDVSPASLAPAAHDGSEG